MKKILILFVVAFLLIGNLMAQTPEEEQIRKEKILKDYFQGGDITAQTSGKVTEDPSGRVKVEFEQLYGDQPIYLGPENRDKFALEPGSKLIVTINPDGTRTYEIKGFAREVRFGEVYLPNIRNAIFPLNANGNFRNVKFTPETGGTYVFDPFGRTTGLSAKNNLVLDTNPGDDVIINFEKNQFAGRSKTGKPIKSSLRGHHIESTAILANFDKDGNFADIRLDPNSIFTSADGHTITSDKTFAVLLDGSNLDIEKLPNAVRISKHDWGFQFDLKGEMKLANHVDYTGLSADARTSYTLPNEGEKSFDVKQGNAIVENDAHKLKFIDGKVFLDRKNLNDVSGEDSSFNFKYAGKDKSFTGKIDEAKDQLHLNAFREGKIVDTKVIPFEEYDQIMDANRREAFVNARKELESKAASGEISKEAADMAELALIDQLNQQTFDVNEQISRIQDYLSTPKSSEAQMNARMILAEKLSVRGDAADFEQAIKEFESAKKLSESLGDKSALYDIHMGLGRAYTEKGQYDRAQVEFLGAALNTDSSQEEAMASLGTALARAQEGDLKNMLFSMRAAMKLDPNNPGAAAFEQQVVDNILKNVDARIKGPELQALKDALGTKFGVTERALQDNWGAVAERLKLATTQNPARLLANAFLPHRINEFGDAAKQEAENMGRALQGSWGLKQINNLGPGKYRDFNAASDAIKLDMLARATGLGDSYFTAGTDGQAALRELKNSIEYAERQIPDINALKSFGERGTFNSPEAYFVRGEELKTTWKGALLDEINVKNAASVLLGGAVLGKGAQLLGNTALGARGTQIIASTRATIGGTRAIQALASPKLAVPRAIVNFLLEEGTETGVGYATGKLVSPEFGNVVELAFGGSGILDSAKRLGAKSFKLGAASAVDNLGNVRRIGTIDFNNIDDYNIWREAADAGKVRGVKPLGNGVYDFNGKEIIPKIGDGMDITGSGLTIIQDINSPLLDKHFSDLSTVMAEWNGLQPFDGTSGKIIDVPSGVGRGLGPEESSAFRKGWKELAENTAKISDDPLKASADLRQSLKLSPENVNIGVINRAVGETFGKYVLPDVSRAGKFGNAEVLEGGFKEVREVDLQIASRITDPDEQAAYLHRIYNEGVLIDSQGNVLNEVSRAKLADTGSPNFITINQGVKVRTSQGLVDLVDYKAPGMEQVRNEFAKVDATRVMEEIGHSSQLNGASISPHTDNFRDWAIANRKFQQIGYHTPAQIQSAVNEADILGWVMHQDPRLVNKGLIENHLAERALFVEYWNSVVVPQYGKPRINYP
jgi:tetratricopeptide (TPR) repeat protein